MTSKIINQKLALTNAFGNVISNPSAETFSKFATECAKTDIERSPLSDKEKEFRKTWKDLGHELFATKNIKMAQDLYCKLDSMLMCR